MIIDIHSHIAYDKIYPRPYLTGMLGYGNSGLTESKIAPILSMLLKDAECDRFVRQMDTAGIYKAVLLIIDGGLGLEEAPMSLNDIYQLHYHVLQKFPDKFIVFAGVDPRRGRDGVCLFNTGIHDYGFKGLKLYPPMGYAMDDSRLDEYYKICEENQLPVLLHTGPSLPRLKNGYADPKFIYRVALKFPRVNFILAHAGYNLSNPSLKFLTPLPNIFYDIAGYQQHLDFADSIALENLGLMFGREHNHKVLFGTDWPLFNLLTPMANHIDMLKRLYTMTTSKVDGGLENILYYNSARLLQLT